MSKPLSFEVASTLNATPEAVWEQVATMRGVNAELWPFVRMTAPTGTARFDPATTPVGKMAFRSTLLLFGVIPYDLHSLRFTEITPNNGFVEHSTSLMQKAWSHERWLQRVPEGTLLRDRVTFVPRMPWLDAVLLPIFKLIFLHRHRQLQRIFGAPPRVSLPAGNRPSH